MGEMTGKEVSTIQSKLFTGLRWTALSQGLQQILNLGCSVVMARLLAPEDFGILAMACVFTGVVYFVLDMGLTAALVQRRELQPQQISTVFWIDVLLGLTMTLIGFGSAGWIAQFYQNPVVQPVIMLLSCNFLITSLSRTQAAVLTRNMAYRTLELRTLISQGAGVGGAIALAVAGLGVWSLAGRIVISGFVGTLLLWSIASWRPRWEFSASGLPDLVRFGRDVLAGNLLAYISRNADNLLIGRFIGATGLGYYSWAYNLMMLPIHRFTQVLASAVFPALAHLQEDRLKVQRAWFRAIGLIGAVVIPAMVGLIILAPQVVTVVYGAKWLPAVPVLQVLCVNSIVQSLNRIDSTVLLALGQTRLRLKLTVVSVVLAMLAFLIGLPYGILGVAVAYTLVSTGTSLFATLKTLEALGTTFLQYSQALVGVTMAAAGMATVLIGCANLPLTPGPLLLLAIPLGGATYLLLLRSVAIATWKELWRLLPAGFTRRLKFLPN
jgi:O-antigen/teichoic acid export membrane protein